MTDSRDDLRTRQPSLGDGLANWLAGHRPPIAVIIEPRSEILLAWGLPNSTEGALSYVRTLSEAMYGLVPLVKIQPAAFERFGPAGWVALREAIVVLRDCGTAVLLDTKRSDHAPVLRSLVRTYVGSGSHYGAHGLTVLPYLGMPDIVAAAPTAEERGGLLLVIARTGNAGAAVMQGARHDEGDVVDLVVDAVAAHNRAFGPTLGLVLGGDPNDAASLVERSSGPLVLPGWGRPGVDTEAIRRIVDLAPDQVLVSVGSRFTTEGPSPQRLRDYLRRVASDLGC